jgi:hypothetical protein
LIAGVFVTIGSWAEAAAHSANIAANVSAGGSLVSVVRIFIYGSFCLLLFPKAEIALRTGHGVVFSWYAMLKKSLGCAKVWGLEQVA